MLARAQRTQARSFQAFDDAQPAAQPSAAQPTAAVEAAPAPVAPPARADPSAVAPAREAVRTRLSARARGLTAHPLCAPITFSVCLVWSRLGQPEARYHLNDFPNSETCLDILDAVPTGEL